MAKTIKEIIGSFSEDEVCNYCEYQSEGCNSGVTGGPNGPIYPACADRDLEDLLDADAIMEAYEAGEFDKEEE